MHRSSAKLGIVLMSAATFVSACGVQSVLGPDDKAIISDIQAKLFQDSVLKTRDIRVTSSKGVVVLTGRVQTDLEKAGAERLASQASGVKQVENQLAVASNTVGQVEPSAGPVREGGPPREPNASAAVRPTPRAKSRAAVKRGRAAVESRDAATSSDDEATPPE